MILQSNNPTHPIHHGALDQQTLPSESKQIPLLWGIPNGRGVLLHHKHITINAFSKNVCRDSTLKNVSDCVLSFSSSGVVKKLQFKW